MAYRFRLKDASVEEGARRIALEQVRLAVAGIDDPALSPDRTVHQVRRHTKKLRALLRLLRPVFTDYKAENAHIRDAAAELSLARDAVVLIEAFDGLKRASRGPLPHRVWGVRQMLVENRRIAAGGDLLDEKLARFRQAMAETGERVKAWKIEADGFDALSGGLSRVYEDAREALAEAQRGPAPEALHEWRKRVKDHWHHIRMLCPLRPGDMKPRRKAALRLSEMLGRHHDLCVLVETLASERRAIAPEERQDLIVLIAAQRADLERDAFRLGEKLFAESPPELCRRWGGWWDGWRKKKKSKS